MQQHDEDEQEAQDEQRGRRVGDADLLGDEPERVAPDREDENHPSGDEPEKGVALLQPPAADELEDHEQEERRGDRGEDRDAKRDHGSSSRRTAGLRNRLTNTATSTFAA